MLQEMFLEFDEFKLEVLRENAYELDLNLESYLSLMIEDMVTLKATGDENEAEQLMQRYMKKKWKNRICEDADERFSEEYSHYISSIIEDFNEDYPTGSKEECIDYVISHSSEYIYEEKEFNCDSYIHRLAESLLAEGN